jgi:hypothetical protein
VDNPQGERQIDWSRVERWAAQLAAGDPSDLQAVFRADYGNEPSMQWNPQARDLVSDKLRFLLEHWTSLRRDGALPRTDDIDPIDMRPALGFVMLIDAVDGGRDFRYRLYGSAIAAVSEFDMTGKLLSSHGASTLVIEQSLATYRAALMRREAVYTVRAPIRAQYTAHWHRVAMPLVDESGTVVRFLAGAVPLSHKGNTLAGRF